MNYVYSTASNDRAHIEWIQGAEGSVPIRGKSVVIHGKANIADKNFHTPEGVVTEVSDEDLAFLMTHRQFLTAIERGFYSVQKRESAVAKVVKDMTKKDKSAPKTHEDFKNASTFKDEKVA